MQSEMEVAQHGIHASRIVQPSTSYGRGGRFNFTATVKNEIGMESGEKTDKKYPTLWLLHGATDDQTTWQRRTTIERYVAPLGIAVVMPSAHLSSYTDMAHGGAFYTYIVEELPVLMRQFFPLSEKREDNYVAEIPWVDMGQ